MMLTTSLVGLKVGNRAMHMNLYGCITVTHRQKTISTLIAILLHSRHSFRLARQQKTKQKPTLRQKSTARYFTGISGESRSKLRLRNLYASKSLYTNETGRQNCYVSSFWKSKRRFLSITWCWGIKNSENPGLIWFPRGVTFIRACGCEGHDPNMAPSVPRNRQDVTLKWKQYLSEIN